VHLVTFLVEPVQPHQTFAKPVKETVLKIHFLSFVYVQILSMTTLPLKTVNPVLNFVLIAQVLHNVLLVKKEKNLTQNKPLVIVQMVPI
jgi:hypothetical protein